ncbi:MAG: hypothetical protein K940chlam3_00848 [Chlamydiae bacterium]|nr:hypothetical protein [Chlamydiota bacterium]
MQKKNLEDFKDDFPLLLEAGFVAVKQLDEASARHLFNAAQLLSPESSAPRIGLGYIALNKLEVKEATEIFTEITEDEPENHLAMTFLGICYLLTKAKRSQGEKMIKKIIEETSDETIVNLGSIALQWAEKDLKKLKSPFVK